MSEKRIKKLEDGVELLAPSAPHHCSHAKTRMCKKKNLRGPTSSSPQAPTMDTTAKLSQIFAYCDETRHSGVLTVTMISAFTAQES